MPKSHFLIVENITKLQPDWGGGETYSERSEQSA